MFLKTDDNNNVIQIFKPSSVQTVTDPTTFTVSDAKAVMFQDAVTLYIGTATLKTYVLPAGVQITIPDDGITVTTATTALLM